jgi:hypothetical protein
MFPLYGNQSNAGLTKFTADMRKIKPAYLVQVAFEFLSAAGPNMIKNDQNSSIVSLNLVDLGAEPVEKSAKI